VSPYEKLSSRAIMQAPLPAPPTSEFSLSSVVTIPKRLEKWRRLDDSEPLAQLHKKFWAKTVAQEEEA
jgi:hypothetical protein